MFVSIDLDVLIFLGFVLVVGLGSIWWMWRDVPPIEFKDDEKGDK